MVKLLIVSFHHPQSHAIGAQRTKALACHAAGRGWDVSMLTSGQSGAGCLLLRPSGHSGWDLIAGADSGPPASNRLVIPPTGTGESGARVPEILRRSLSRHRGALKDWPDPPRERRWGRQALRLVAEYLEEINPDVIVSSGPPWVTHQVAAQAAASIGVPWMPDYRDLWSSSPYYPFPTWRRLIDRRIEMRLLTRASAATTATPLSSTKLALDSSLTVSTVLNGFVSDELAAIPAAQLGPGRHLTYAGSWYGNRRDPRPILESMALPGMQDTVLHLVGETSPWVEDMVRELNLRTRVRFTGPLTRTRALSHVKGSDVAVLLMWNDPREASVIPGKLYEYIGLAKPVMAVGYGAGNAGEIMRAYGRARFANSPSEVKQVLERLVHAPAPPAENINVFDRDHQNAMWEDLLEECVMRQQA